MTTAAPYLPGLGRVLAPPGVYAPQADSLLLARAMRREGIRPGMRVLDLCTGSGALAVHAARTGAQVTAVDIARRAVAAARLNALFHGQRIAVHRGDLMTSLPADSFDVVVSNPPYVPAPRAAGPSRGAARAWDAGHRGRLLLDRICDTAPGVLRPHGVLLLVHSGLCDAESTIGRLTDAGLRADVSDRAWIPYGPVLRSRMAWLRASGLIGEDDRAEELVIIRAEKP